MGPTRSEQETTFRIAADEDVVSVFTAYLPTRRKIERAGYTPTRVSRQGAQAVGWFYKIPRNEFRWRVGRRRPLTPAQQAAGQALASRGKARKLLGSDDAGRIGQG